MAVITRSITNNLTYSFTILAPGTNTNQNANLIIPASAVNLDLLTLCTEDTLWALQPALLSMQRAGDITVTGTIDTSSFEYDGVASLHADSSPAIRGDIQLISGSGISLFQVGQVITVASLSSAVSTIAGTVTPNATTASTFSTTVTGALTINGPTGGVDGQKITFRILNDGSHSVTFSTGSGNFRFGTDIPSYTNSVSLTDYIGAIWNNSASCWDIVSVIQGF